MQTILKNIKRYFLFSKRDINGITALSLLLVLSICLKISHTSPLKNPGKNKDENSSDFARTSDSLSRIEKNDPPPQNSSKTEDKKQNYKAPSYMNKKFMVELNQGDSLDFDQLYGIGKVYAKRIVAYRERLGGYVRKEQLMEVWGIDSSLYKKIEASVLIATPLKIRKLNINKASLDDFKKHPYLDYYQAKEIIRYRDKQGLFKTIEELKEVSLLDAETFTRLRPYLCLE